MEIIFSLRGGIADDYTKSPYSNSFEFISSLIPGTDLAALHQGGTIKVCYTRERAREIPSAVPFPQVIKSLMGSCISNKGG